MSGVLIEYADGTEELVVRCFGVWATEAQPEAFVIQRQERGPKTWLTFAEVTMVSYDRPDLLPPPRRRRPRPRSA